MKFRVFIFIMLILSCCKTVQAKELNIPFDKDAAVTNVKLVNKKGGKLKVTYKRVPEGRYQIQLSRKRDFKKRITYEIIENPFVFTNLKKNKVYYVRIRAYYPAYDGAVFGPWSKVKKIRIRK